MSVEQKLKELGLELPPPLPPQGAYRPVVVVGDIAHLSGQGPVRADRSMITGRVPDERSVEEAIEAARLTGLNALAQIKAHFGTLDVVEEVVKVFGLVNAAPGFGEHPRVIDGFSKLMIDVFGPLGAGARSAVGASSLPMNISVEVEMAIKLKR